MVFGQDREAAQRAGRWPVGQQGLLRSVGRSLGVLCGEGGSKGSVEGVDRDVGWIVQLEETGIKRAPGAGGLEGSVGCCKQDPRRPSSVA